MPETALPQPDSNVHLRRFPYPYRAMFAICSDLDETPDRHVYWEIVRFLNTTATTSMGLGVGLEVGNSIYFDMPLNQFAYWNTDDAGRDMVRTLIRSGHIDCLHSYGDLATTRRHAGRALDELDHHGCRLQVWVDHSKAPTNLGADIMLGQGDLQGSSAYHADLTTTHGVKYVWRGRVTSMIGQNASPCLAGIPSLRHPIASAKTVIKEEVKSILARLGSVKYDMHGPNRVFRPVRLRDGRPVLEFLRCNPHWGGVSCGDTSSDLSEVLTKRFLDRLVWREAVCILYTHMGKLRSCVKPLPGAVRVALRRLAEYQADGQILVTTTFRLLQYLHVRDSLRYRTERKGERLIVEIQRLEDAVYETGSLLSDEICGLTFEVAWSGDVEVRLWTGSTIACSQVRAGNLVLVTIPWQPLAFPGWRESA